MRSCCCHHYAAGRSPFTQWRRVHVWSRHGWCIWNAAGRSGCEQTENGVQRALCMFYLCSFACVLLKVAAVFSKDALESSVQRRGPAFSRMGGKFRCHVYLVYYEPAWYSILEIGSGRQSEHDLRRVSCWCSIQVRDMTIIYLQSHACSSYF